MAELIDADKLNEELYKRVMQMQGYRAQGFEIARNIVNKQPTTTEADIRAKAISDYLQFVYDNASNEEYANEDGWAMSDLIDLEFKYLEQLKESE